MTTYELDRCYVSTLPRTVNADSPEELETWMQAQANAKRNKPVIGQLSMTSAPGSFDFHFTRNGRSIRYCRAIIAS